MLFTYSPDNQEALASAPAVRRHPHPDAAQRASTFRAASTLPAAAVFHRGGVIGERFAGAGLTQRALHGRVVNPTGKGITFSSEVPSGQLPSVRYDGRLFPSGCRSSSGAAYPAVPADGLFRVHARSAFPAGHGSAPPVRQGDVSVHRYRQEVSCSYRVYYPGHSASTRIKRLQHSQGRKQSFRLPPVDTFQQHRQLCRCEEHFAIPGSWPRRSGRAPAVWSADTVHRR